MVRELSGAFDQWWAECLPLMVNENVIGPRVNPFQAMYYRQFGGEPTAAALEQMDPEGAKARVWQSPRARKPKDGATGKSGSTN